MIDEAWWIGFIKDRHIMDADISARCSDILLSQLVNMPCYGGMNYPFQFVVHEILAMEGKNEKTHTKGDGAFRRSELQGFWKKHFCVPQYHLGTNAALALKLANPKSNKFSDLVQLSERECIPLADDQEQCAAVLSKKIAERFMQEVWKRRESGEDTGDYLVYLPFEGKNYYLCIARHSQDAFVRDCIEKCVPQFSFIQAVLSDTAGTVSADKANRFMGGQL